MENELTLVATITAKAGKAENLKDALVDLVAPTRAEVGCLQYDLHQDNQDPQAFVFLERWSGYDVWHDHMESTHIKAYIALSDDLVNEFVVKEMHAIG
ncbi:antibiotic biosynthesis monooxygenase [Marinomonas sp. M1K-6]|uniref:Antibiotic biosynthesis monooxygenase n=1 Tax=Marinomonas profundi TaxID=2726122 RepID=A0A847R9N8_9GAMM|nr:putative quinol monooxygenase [Marinomonas profundi]NLQ18766.1 antibiotic biosynthesis monooxygenase [Marinomonas profundi]UDV03989.1 antibiotic biosynthesis monooxygenase [Marinomonas profundi]